MEQEIKILVLVSGEIIISQIEEVAALDIGQPDCKLTKPFVVTGDNTLEQFLIGVTKDDAFMIGSDKILTIAEPTPTLLEKYLDIIKE